VTSPSLPIPDVPPAQASIILCGPWASPSDIPEHWRGRASDNQWLVILGLASEVLYSLTGHQWRGVGCSDRLVMRSRPPSIGSGSWPFLDAYACGCWAIAPGYGFATTYADAWMFNTAWRGLHPSPMAIELDADAMAITRVERSNADDLDPTAYRLSKSGWAERVDGQGWQLCGADGYTTIHYDKGQAPPAGGVVAAVNLAIEFVKSWCGDAGCALPQNATQVTRQGISITMDTSAFLKESRTGVPIVDMWIETVNPRRKSGSRPIRQGSVWSPDLPAGTRIGPPA
jgi:hypothetical protein